MGQERLYPAPGPRNLITDVSGIQVGNAHDEAVATGVSVILPQTRAVAAYDTRGGGPGTRETDALDPVNLVDAVDAVFLSGGSSYGLAAGSAITDWLGARGRGFALMEGAPVSPVVPGAILYDLANGGDKRWRESPPYAELARRACESAGAEFALGNAGAGFGAAAGNLKGGLGSASIATPEGLQIGALVAVNAFGAAVIPGTGRLWAAYAEQNREMGGQPPLTEPLSGARADFQAGTKAGGPAQAGGNTTIGVVALNAALTPAQARRIAIMGQDGLARSLRPVHTPLDGDTLFVLATGALASAPMEALALARAGALAADCVARAVGRAVFEARGLNGIPAYREVFGPARRR